jgi:hypothetical protein
MNCQLLGLEQAVVTMMSTLVKHYGKRNNIRICRIRPYVTMKPSRE